MGAQLAFEIPDTFLIYISTDYIFDGTDPPYKPNSKPNPLNDYGKTKLAGEEAIWKVDHSAGVLRVPILYGPSKKAEESAVTTLINALQLGKEEKSPVEVDHCAVRFPTFTPDVAQCVRSLAERRMKHCSLSGTWHFSGNESMTKYEMVVKIAQLLGVTHDHVIAKTEPDTGAVSRPHNSQLETSAVRVMGFLKITPFEQAMRQVLDGL